MKRSDIVLVSLQVKKIGILELTVSFEPCMVDVKIRKQDRYASLVNDISDNGCTCEPFTIEVGSRSILTKDCVSSLKPFKMSYDTVKVNA